MSQFPFALKAHSLHGRVFFTITLNSLVGRVAGKWIVTRPRYVRSLLPYLYFKLRALFTVKFDRDECIVASISRYLRRQNHHGSRQCVSSLSSSHYLQ